MRILLRLLLVLLLVLIAAALGIWMMFGGGHTLPDRTGEPALPGAALEEVVALDFPPGNVAVSPRGRIFFSYHPDGNPPAQVLELVDGRPVPYPNAALQSEREEGVFYQSVLALRVDRQERLWILDHAHFGRGEPRLLAFDLQTDELVHEYVFPPEVAGFPSMLNDFQVDPEGRKIYIAETSPILQSPALIVYDTLNQTSLRRLEDHPSLQAENYVIQAPGRDMVLLGIFTLRIAVDSIALDRRGEWLYYGPVNGATLYRIRAAALANESLDDAALGERVEAYGPKTLSDGITTDTAGNVYLSDMEHSAVVMLTPERKLITLIEDERLRWPDGFSFGPEGWLYVTCSALHHVLFRSDAHMRAHAPYHIYRFQPGGMSVPGH